MSCAASSPRPSRRSEKATVVRFPNVSVYAGGVWKFPVEFGRAGIGLPGVFTLWMTGAVEGCCFPPIRRNQPQVLRLGRRGDLRSG